MSLRYGVCSIHSSSSGSGGINLSGQQICKPCVMGVSTGWASDRLKWDTSLLMKAV